MTPEILKELKAMQQQINDLAQRIDNMYSERCNKGDADHEKNHSDIDYIAIVSDIDLDE